MTVWMAFLAMMLAVNPPRRALELDPRPRPDIAALGAAVVLAVVVVVAWMSDPLLSALDVSDATWRIAAGLVLAARGLVDLVLAPRLFPEGWSGSSEALIPVAFPVLMRPEVVAIGLAVGTDRGVVVAGAAAAVALAAAAAAMTWWTQQAPARAVAAVISAASAAVGITLMVQGVLDL
jgi:small neutral amino acid transporter SnatA (MarC family)